MDTQDLLEAVKNLPSDRLEIKLNALVRENLRFKNLDEGNKKIILGLIKKYLPKIRRGLGLSHLNFRDEMHELYENRVKLDLTEEDLKDIREILELFEK